MLGLAVVGFVEFGKEVEAMVFAPLYAELDKVQKGLKNRNFLQYLCQEKV